MRRSTYQWKKGFFSEKGGGNSVNGGFGKDFYRKGNSVKRSVRYSEPPDSENWKVAVLIPFPKISSYTSNWIWMRLFYLQLRSFYVQQVLNPTPLNPAPVTCHKWKTEVALQFSESCAAETIPQHSLFCSADLVFYQKLRCNKRKTALQHWISCITGKWRFPAAFLRISNSHI